MPRKNKSKGEKSNDGAKDGARAKAGHDNGHNHNNNCSEPRQSSIPKHKDGIELMQYMDQTSTNLYNWLR